MMADTIRVPGIGPVKKPWLYAGIAATVAIIGFAYYRRRQMATAEVPAAGATTTEASADTYAQSSDAAGYNTVYPSAYSGQSYNPYGYDIYGNPLPAPTGATGAAGAYTTNNDWANAAEAAMDPPLTREVSSPAISRVLGGLTVTSDQQAIFLQAVGLLGQPPQGYPQPIRLTDTPAQPGPAIPGTLKAPGGVKATHIDKTYVDLDWAPVVGATGYKIYVNGAAKTSSLYSMHRVTRLTANHSYRIGVAGVIIDATGPGSKDIIGPVTTISVHTRK